MTIKRCLHTLALGCTLVVLSACAGTPAPHKSHGHGAVPVHGLDMKHETGSEAQPLKAVDLRNTLDVDGVVSKLGDTRVIYVGEFHDNYGHHLAQLDVVRALHRQGSDIAIGLEMFQQPYQAQLDSYIAGETSERQMLRETEWYDRWRFDFRLYKPVLDYAREHAIPLVALNVSSELKERVSEVGVDGLNPQERAAIPAEIDRSDKVYESRLKKIFVKHMDRGKKSFERFVDVQLLWDESMAERAADYLQANPGRRLVVLAGGGHLAYGSGIPNRVKRRVDVTSAIILPADNRPVTPGVADFMIYPSVASLPQQGLMGVMLDKGEEGVLIAHVLEESAADKAGLERKDTIIRFDGEPVKTPGDLKVLLMGKQPGDSVRLQVRRSSILFGDEQLDFEFALGQ
ncbi:MAG: ChaN family lipoprotein [Sedimenticola sp.]